MHCQLAESTRQTASAVWVNCKTKGNWAEPAAAMQPVAASAVEGTDGLPRGEHDVSGRTTTPSPPCARTAPYASTRTLRSPNLQLLFLARERAAPAVAIVSRGGGGGGGGGREGGGHFGEASEAAAAVRWY